jgi:integrase
MRRQGHIQQRGRNSWRLKFAVAGKEKYVTVKGSKADAQNELNKLLAAVATNTFTDPSQMTVAVYVADYLDSARDLSAKTLERYRELFTRQIAPHLGDVKIQRLTVEGIRAWHASLSDTKLSARTIGHAHRLLRTVLGQAVRAGTLGRNVASLQAPPKAEDREIEIIPADELSAFLTQLWGSPLCAIAIVALFTGLRRGEILGLQWGDVDLDSKPPTLRVERSLEETRAGLKLKNPKTKRSRRKLVLPPEAVEVLRARKVELMQLRLVTGEGAIKPDTYVFSNANGGPLSPDNMSRDWGRWIRSHPDLSQDQLSRFKAYPRQHVTGGGD